MRPSPMPSDDFWQIISRTVGPGFDQDAQANALRAALRELSLEQVVSFEVAFRRYLNQAYTWDLWGAAYVIHGGCSDDGFEYFRRWLVSRGRDLYETAVADPDSLSQLDVGPDQMLEFEGIYYVIGAVFEAKGGEGDVRDHSEPEAGLDGPQPSGQPFAEDEAHLAQRYPKLWRRFGNDPLG